MPTHKWTTTGGGKCYKCEYECIYNPLQSSVQMVVVVGKKPKQESVQQQDFTHRPHMCIHTHLHTQMLQAWCSHNKITESQWEWWNLCVCCVWGGLFDFFGGVGVVGGQAGRQAEWKQWMWPIAALLLTCSLSHVRVLVQLQRCLITFSVFYLASARYRRIGNTSDREHPTENRQERKRCIQREGKSTMGLISISVRMNLKTNVK